MTFINERYRELREMLPSQRLPLAYVDLMACEVDAVYAASPAHETGKTNCVRKNPIRWETLTGRILDHSGIFRGFQKLSIIKAKFFTDKHSDGFIVAFLCFVGLKLQMLDGADNFTIYQDR